MSTGAAITPLFSAEDNQWNRKRYSAARNAAANLPNGWV